MITNSLLSTYYAFGRVGLYVCVCSSYLMFTWGELILYTLQVDIG